jgi:uncharacterized protein (TIGR03083 family)
MGSRPLRQYYDEVAPIEVDERLGSVVTPWLRHRQRFAARLAALTDEQWAAPSRCAGWTNQDVVSHLVTADEFWVASLHGAAAGSPTAYLAGFDPTAVPEALVAPTRSLAPGEVLDRFLAVDERFVAAVTSQGDDAWASLGESPVGHVPARLALAHALWDSWLHERDILVPLGLEDPVEADELRVAAWYVLAVGSAQGGLLGDPAPVGPGLTEPIDATLVFADLPDDPIHLVVDQGVLVERASDGRPAGSACELVEGYTGRRPIPAGALPTALDEHLRRAFQIL